MFLVDVAPTSEISMAPKSSQDPHVVFRVFDIMWCVVFVLELGVRILAEGWHFVSWYNPEPLGSASVKCAAQPIIYKQKGNSMVIYGLIMV